jgi:hypothetical protein
MCGRFASTAPIMLHTHIQSQYGNGELVMWAKIILPTWCANCSPHAHRKGTNTADLMIAECRSSGCESHATWIATGITKGSSKSKGRTEGFPVALVAWRTLR